MFTEKLVYKSIKKLLYKENNLREQEKLRELLKIEMHEKFLYALNLSEEGKSFFLTGKPGTGKSVFLRMYKALIGNKKNYAILAPTGGAAINVEGQTIHSFFSFDFGIQGNESAFGMREESLAILRGLDVLLIDEISMARPDILDGVSYCLRYARNSTQPFGGVQMIFVGDLAQVPPVLKPEVLEILSSKKYLGGKCFHSKEYIQLKPERIIFDKVYRQDNKEFLEILDRMGIGETTEKDLRLLNSKGPFPDLKNYIHLCCTKKSAEAKNLKALALLNSKSFICKANITGKFSEKSFPTSQALKVKKGARVILLVNNYEQGSHYVNGDLGYLEKIECEENGEPSYLVVRLDRTDETVLVEKNEWENIEYSVEEKKDEKGNIISKEIVKKVSGTFEQFPIALGWALTIHKSQGKTLDNVVIDFGRGAFSFGQAYVAVSRCTSLENLYFHRPITKRDILVDPEVIDYLNGKTRVDLDSDEDSLRELFKKVMDSFDFIEKERKENIFINPKDKTDIAFRVSEELLKFLKFDTLIER